MIILLLFAFLAGIVTVLSPCILPLLPIILSSSDQSGKQKPFGVVIGFVASFTFFTLFLSTIVRFSGIPADSLRYVAIVMLFIFGLTLLIPQIQARLEKLFTLFTAFAPQGQKHQGLWGGILIGGSLGLLWTPCVGPILASVITLALTGTVTTQAVFITLAYAIGTAIPMFAIMLAGSSALQRVPWLVRNTSKIQRGFGLLMILTALAIYFNVDRRFQTFILTTFPNYGVGLTRLEDTEQVQQQLQQLNQRPVEADMIGKTTADISQTKGVLAPELIPGGQWFNSEPFQLADLKGKVVLVDFWTYSCINCQRTLPYLRDWDEKYRDDGLVIIGVHSPEFEFEKQPKNIIQSIDHFELKYPIVQDNNFATWRAYNNRYWPAKYLIDKDGYIRYTYFGEGAYDETEQKIQELLREKGSFVSNEQIANPKYQLFARTPELYLGYDRLQYLASPENIQPDRETTFSVPNFLPENSFAYEGTWIVMPEYASTDADGKLYLNFEAKDVFLVARPKEGSGVMKIYLDDRLQASSGDVDENGNVVVDSDRLYHLIELSQPGKHQLRIEFPNGNVEVYAFTFG